MASSRDLLAALRDPVRFAEVLCGAPLWDHQVQIIRSPARYRILCAGRQAGKSRLFAVMALHKAFSQPGAVILIISAGETAAQRLLAEVSGLASSPMLAASVTDETKGTVTLSNGSQILSVPASQKQIRGWAIDLLIMDEAGFIDPSIWRAAEPVIIARPGSKIIMCSSPWGSAEHFFRQLWRRGTDSPGAMYAAWHWPSSISPLVDRELLEEIRKREGDAYFNREYLAIWDDDGGSFLTEEEISSAVASYELVSPDRVAAWSPWDRWSERRERCYTAAAGVDWAYARDAQALVLIAALDDGGLNGGREHRYYLPWLEFAYKTPYAAWVTKVADAANGYGLRVAASECNGVGAHPTQALADEIGRRGLGCHVAAVWTDARRKMSGFGMIKMMLQQNLLILPREPELLKQLRCLEHEQLPGGSVRISVPERSGHDDLAMALMQAVSCIRPCSRGDGEIPERLGLPYETTGGGVRVPSQPRPVEWHSMSYAAPAGREREPASAW
jgi:Terminase large subunit, T4likevirus-type, N-terminal